MSRQIPRFRRWRIGQSATGSDELSFQADPLSATLGAGCPGFLRSAPGTARTSTSTRPPPDGAPRARTCGNKDPPSMRGRTAAAAISIPTRCPVLIEEPEKRIFIPSIRRSSRQSLELRAGPVPEGGLGQQVQVLARAPAARSRSECGPGFDGDGDGPEGLSGRKGPH